VICVSLFAYLPILIGRMIIKKIFPTEESKIMKKVGIKKKGRIKKFIEKFIFCSKETIKKEDYF